MKRSPLRRRTGLARGAGPKRKPWPGRGGKLTHRPPTKPKRLRKFGTDARTRWIREQPCVCQGHHPACTGGWSEPSHVVSRGAGGTASDIVPMSRGCHAAWHQHGRETYCRTMPFSADQLRQLARYYAKQGPDAPGDPT